jgi:hypothetical protein
MSVFTDSLAVAGGARSGRLGGDAPRRSIAEYLSRGSDSNGDKRVRLGGDHGGRSPNFLDPLPAMQLLPGGAVLEADRAVVQVRVLFAPFEVSRAVFPGKTIIQRTSAGTQGIVAASKAERLMQSRWPRQRRPSAPFLGFTRSGLPCRDGRQWHQDRRG